MGHIFFIFITQASSADGNENEKIELPKIVPNIGLAKNVPNIELPKSVPRRPYLKYSKVWIVPYYSPL